MRPASAMLRVVVCLWMAGCAGTLERQIGQRKSESSRAESLAALARSCDAGEAERCNDLAVRYRDGQGVEKDSSRAAALFRKACWKTAAACDSLGELLLETDQAGATEAFWAGCDAGEQDPARPRSCLKLGFAYQFGWGIPVDLELAQSQYALACSTGEPEGCVSLGLVEAKGGPDDVARSAGHFRQACDRGNSRGCKELGLMYEQGTGVQADPVKAARYLEQACEGGIKEACAPQVAGASH
ncbi:MAG TPA: tetratricopeptide repeat protein [Myxococcaceae bacterium]|nr:tetratricopeptide repeat protein [Myxococcaceae bacterium]